MNYVWYFYYTIISIGQQDELYGNYPIDLWALLQY